MEYRLEEVADFQKGFAFKSKDFIQSGVRIVKVTNLTNESIDLSGCVYIDENLANNYRQYSLQQHDIIITTVGSWPTNPASVVGKVVRVPKKGKNSLLNQNAVRVRSNENINQKYLYYLLRSNTFKEYIIGTAQGSANQASITQKDIKNFKYNIPQMKVQEAIAKILSSLDEKIEVNNQISKTLEAMAQEIYKHWFVDFEFPNEDGEPYKSSGGEMVESELGMIPRDWEVVKLSEIGIIVTGKTPSTQQLENFGYEYNFITPRDLNNDIYIIGSERQLSKIGSDKMKTIKVKKNSIGVSCIGSNLGEVYITAEDGFTNQQINSLILNEEEIYPFVFITLKNMKEVLLNLAGGSAVPIINKTTFSGIQIVKPSNTVLYKFVNAVNGMFDTIKLNLTQNKILSELKNTLLPRLMSGEIKVSHD